ncbi:MAG: tRNA (adenosine(37)-N6)-threonylcarbamoyltransferase complex ATPase subunit type 1 TsaE [Candidatus Babeliales bacterium]
MLIMNNKKIIYASSQLAQVAQELLGYMSECAVYTFTGPLGAGKTALVRQMLHQLGIEGPIPSPTFTYLNKYENAHDQIFYHFDLYRIPDRQDFIASGFDEYLYQPHSWAFIEWPEPIMPLLQKNVCHVHIDYCGDKRELIYQIVN